MDEQEKSWVTHGGVNSRRPLTKEGHEVARKKYDYKIVYNVGTRRYRKQRIEIEQPKKRLNKNPGKVKIADSARRQKVIKRDKNKCAKCGCKKWLQVHHIIPRSKGGNNDLNNLITLCDICHMEEHRGENVYNIMIKSFFQYEVI